MYVAVITRFSFNSTRTIYKNACPLYPVFYLEFFKGESIDLQVIVTAMHGGYNNLAVQVHYFIWHCDVISGHNTVCC